MYLSEKKVPPFLGHKNFGCNNMFSFSFLCDKFIKQVRNYGSRKCGLMHFVYSVSPATRLTSLTLMRS